MTNHKVTEFADYDEFKTHVETLADTVSIQVIYSEKKGWVVVE